MPHVVSLHNLFPILACSNHLVFGVACFVQGECVNFGNSWDDRNLSNTRLIIQIVT
ncbi:hypothetical protein ANAPRD1_01244 [Anaplasma phagocytophilum]|nr:hypothetical protein ANAPH2_01444 [Anaplasma phagocytophilum]SCV66727.1 hypothetical protein ANAPRD1_01244 [Anaplasma phagocytophilum]